MAVFPKLDKFAKYAWFVLGYNVLVIIWGVFLRASKSGDGCGQHWLTCQGEVIPSAPQLKTIIEFSHRVTSSLAGIFLIILLVWAIYRWYQTRDDQSRRTMRMAMGSFLFVVIEGLLGAGLVLTGNTAENLTPERPVWMAAHLINTFILLGFLAMTARVASGLPRLVFRTDKKFLGLIAIGGLAVIFVGITGSIAALASMIFPSGTLMEGFRSDFSPTSNMLLRLRLLHPLAAIFSSVIIFFLTGWLAKIRPSRATKRWANIVAGLLITQLVFGSATLLMLSPIIMQLGHLLLADSIWVSYVLFSAAFLTHVKGEAIEADPRVAASLAEFTP